MFLRCLIRFNISIHAPRAGSDPFSRLKAHACKISIHAPRAGSDYARAVLVVVAYISIHAPRAGSDYFPPRSMSQYNNFNPRPPCGERQLDGVKLDANDLFQSTPPVRGATVILSIQHIRNKIFQSTPPVRGATIGTLYAEGAEKISIHAPRAGSDLRFCCRA